MAKYCKSCGLQLEGGARFCPACGTQVISGPEQLQQQQPIYQQPAQGYPPPPLPQQQPVQGYPPHKSPKPNKTLFLIIGIAAAALVVLLIVFGNGTGTGKDNNNGNEPIQPFEPAAPVEETPVLPEPDPGSPEIPVSIHDLDYPMHSSPGIPTVFSFEALSKMDLPRGELTVNQLINKYGPPQTVSGYYLEGYEIIYVKMFYYDKIVYFIPISADSFSLYDQSLEEGEYDLGESDWNIEMEILSIRVFGEDVWLPYGFQFGETSKDQIIAFYGEEPAFVYEHEVIQYYYYDFDENGNLPEGVDAYGTGSISYLLDQNGVLNEMLVDWRYFDL